MSSSAPAIRLTFADADPHNPDPATVGALARATVGGLRTQGESLTPDYTGTKGAAEVFQWMLNAAAVAAPFITLSGFCLTLAQLLNEVKKLREKPASAGPPAAPVTINIYYGSGPPISLPEATTPADATLLEGLLAAQLPAQINPAETTIAVQVPPTPPNEI